MLKNRLAPYILVSALIHIGLLFGMHSFLSLPDVLLEPPVLIPVEMVVLRKQPADPAFRITASEPIAAKKLGSIVQSQLTAHMDSDQGTADIADPIPAEGNYQSSVNLEINGSIRTMRMASQRLKPAGQPEFALSKTPLLHFFPADEQIYKVPPRPKKSDSAPRFTSASIPTPYVPPTTLRGEEVASEPMNLAIQMTSLHLAAVEPLLPAGLTPSDMSTSTDLVEAKAAVSPRFPQVSYKVVTAPVNTQTGEDSIAELRPLPKQVESEPRLMASILKINSHPKGAQVYVDGMLSGDTPLEMELTFGKHEVRLALPDHYDWKAQVDLTETNRSIPISLRLLPVD